MTNICQTAVPETTRAKNTRNTSEIFIEHGEFIRDVIKSQTNNKDLAEDIFQDFFISLSNKPLRRKVENLRGYLYRTVTRDVIDATRKEKRYKARIQRFAIMSGLPDRNKNSPLREMLSREELQRLKSIMSQKLNTAEARAVELRFLSQCNTDEAARIMKVNKRTVSRYLCIGLTKLRKALGQT